MYKHSSLDKNIFGHALYFLGTSHNLLDLPCFDGSWPKMVLLFWACLARAVNKCFLKVPIFHVAESVIR